ncbi:hypothetical protein TIFTF001_009185 [Ficus carica]|uniref:U-box domain-containing protein n=1 Tax=Ficus carica TaxID=3494 RepID=A0AA88AA08_FICCA|nr:hypothetical protein TIFTF001_009185 [Ficus carica]
MKTHQPKLKTQLFSCGFFRHCTQTVLSPTAPQPPPLPTSTSHSPPPPPSNDTSFHQHHHHHPPQQPESSSSSSSSASASQSFTQWRFPLSNSPIHSISPRSEPDNPLEPVFRPGPDPPVPVYKGGNLQELFHAAELQLSSESDSDRVAALYLLERSLVPDPPVDPECPAGLMRGVVGNLRSKAGAKPASKILLALCLAEGNRRVAVEAGAAAAVVEAAPELEGAAAERAMAALELMCTVAEGAAEVRAHALAVPVMVAVMGRTSAREKEYAISVLAVIYGGASEGEEEVVMAPPEAVARAVALALQGECSARGRRKGVQLLQMLRDHCQTTVV